MDAWAAPRVDTARYPGAGRTRLGRPTRRRRRMDVMGARAGALVTSMGIERARAAPGTGIVTAAREASADLNAGAYEETSDVTVGSSDEQAHSVRRTGPSGPPLPDSSAPQGPGAVVT